MPVVPPTQILHRSRYADPPSTPWQSAAWNLVAVTPPTQSPHSSTKADPLPASTIGLALISPVTPPTQVPHPSTYAAPSQTPAQSSSQVVLSFLELVIAHIAPARRRHLRPKPRCSLRHRLCYCWSQWSRRCRNHRVCSAAPLTQAVGAGQASRPVPPPRSLRSYRCWRFHPRCHCSPCRTGLARCYRLHIRRSWVQVGKSVENPCTVFIAGPTSCAAIHACSAYIDPRCSAPDSSKVKWSRPARRSPAYACSAPVYVSQAAPDPGAVLGAGCKCRCLLASQTPQSKRYFLQCAR